MRWLVRVLGALVLLVFLGVVALFLVPTETVARLATDEFRRMTGRELTVEGDLRPTVWPHLGVRTGPIALANADWSEAGPMLTARSLSMTVDLASLFGGAVRVRGIELEEPVLLLERAGDGRANWTFAPALPEAAAGAAAGGAGSAEGAGAAAPDAAPAMGRSFTLDRATITAGRVIFDDRLGGSRTELSALDLTLSVPDVAGLAAVSARAIRDGTALTLDAEVTGLLALLDGRVVPVAFDASAGASTLGFDGRMGIVPLAAEGMIAADLSDLAAVFAALGQPAPGLPAGFGQDSIGLDGKMTLAPGGGLYLREASIRLDGNRLSGALDLVPGEARPRLTAKLAAGALRLAPGPGSAAGDGSGSGSGGGGSGGGGGPAGGWPTDRIDAGGLAALDAEVALTADGIDLGTVAFGPSTLGITLDAARAVVDLQSVEAYGGTLAGQVVVNARKGLSARANLTLTGLALQPFLSAVAGYDRLAGTGDLRFNLLGSGQSVDALMRSLSGEGSLSFGKGELRGFDLAGMIRTMDTSFVGEGASTVYDRITASFTVADGVLSNSDLALAAPLVTATGDGTVDIGGQVLNYRLTPLSLGGKALDPDVQVPVLVSGPWASPKIGLDLEAMARKRLESEAKKLEERARAELQERLQQETGIEPLPGESLEDTARRAAEEALQSEAEKALNRLLGIEN